MADIIDEYTEGWTSPISYTLYHVNPVTGVASTFDASGMTPAIVITDSDGNPVDTTGDVSWDDATVSKIKYTPDAADFDSDKSPYHVKWKVTDLSSAIAFYPQGARMLWRIFPA